MFDRKNLHLHKKYEVAGCDIVIDITPDKTTITIVRVEEDDSLIGPPIMMIALAEVGSRFVSAFDKVMSKGDEK